jgi:hypothetical protein
MQSTDRSTLSWRKSSFSESANCVEVAIREESEVVYIRDSKNRNGAILPVSSSAWREFIDAIRSKGVT